VRRIHFRSVLLDSSASAHGLELVRVPLQQYFRSVAQALSQFQQTTTVARGIEFEVRKLDAREYHGSFEQRLVRRQAAPCSTGCLYGDGD